MTLNIYKLQGHPRSNSRSYISFKVKKQRKMSNVPVNIIINFNQMYY